MYFGKVNLECSVAVFVDVDLVSESTWCGGGTVVGG
jgi:hypothetical protein